MVSYKLLYQQHGEVLEEPPGVALCTLGGVVLAGQSHWLVQNSRENFFGGEVGGVAARNLLAVLEVLRLLIHGGLGVGALAVVHDFIKQIFLDLLDVVDEAEEPVVEPNLLDGEQTGRLDQLGVLISTRGLGHSELVLGIPLTADAWVGELERVFAAIGVLLLDLAVDHESSIGLIVLGLPVDLH
jgi:hypothetical protein